MMRAIALLVCCLLMSACGIFGPDFGSYVETTNRRLLDPIPLGYPVWYTAVEICLGKSGNYDAIIWYVADEIAFDGISALGLWEAPDRITLRATVTYIGSIVRHEMIHHVLQGGSRIHDTDAFDCAESW